MLTFAEENYLKVIFLLEQEKTERINMRAIAEKIDIKPSSVTDMIKRLSDKELISYERYKGVNLTDKGRSLAVMVIRKYRLWEVFLVEKLQFKWYEVQDMAEQLKHISSDEMILRLDDFLKNPDFDPHGDPIPDANGKIKTFSKKLLSELKKGESGICVGVKENKPDFLQFLDKKNIEIGTKITVMGKEFFDGSMVIRVGNENSFISEKITQNLFVKVSEINFQK